MPKDNIDQAKLAKALRQAAAEIPMGKYHRPWARKVAIRAMELYAFYVQSRERV